MRMATKCCTTLEKIKFKVARETDISFEFCHMQRTLFQLRINDKRIVGECRVMQQFVRLSLYVFRFASINMQ